MELQIKMVNNLKIHLEYHCRRTKRWRKLAHFCNLTQQNHKNLTWNQKENDSEQIWRGFPIKSENPDITEPKKDNWSKMQTFSVLINHRMSDKSKKCTVQERSDFVDKLSFWYMLIKICMCYEKKLLKLTVDHNRIHFYYNMCLEHDRPSKFLSRS